MRRGRRAASRAEAAGDDPFGALIDDRSRHLVADFSADSATLLVLFGGIAGGVSMPVFEFFRLVAGYPTGKLFLRDPRRAWYLRGLPGIGADAVAVRDEIARRIGESGARRVVMVGASAGGFAALRFGAELGVAEIHAFSPQTFVDATNRRRAGDERWPEQIAALHAAVGPDSPALDLRPLLERRGEAVGPMHLHVGDDDPLDLAHAAHVADLPGVTVHEYADGGHTLVKRLRDRGDLERLLLRAIQAPGPLVRGAARS